jgi:hypothetical protein
MSLNHRNKMESEVHEASKDVKDILRYSISHENYLTLVSNFPKSDLFS